MTASEPLTFEKVWSMFQETDRKFQETDRKFQETDKKIKESDREWQKTRKKMKQESDREWQEIRKERKETERIVKENARQMGYLNNRFGELAEHLVAPNIMEKFNALNFSFEQMSLDHSIKDTSGRFITEIDILLENNKTVMVVEVKSKPNQNDINEHLKRMEILRERANARNDKRKYFGAIAGAIMKETVREYARKSGFYVIEQNGDTVKIEIPDGFKAREW